MLHFCNYFFSLFFVLLVHSNSFFEPSSHCFLLDHRGFFLFILNLFSGVLLVFIGELFGVLSYESLIVRFILLLFLLLFWGARGRFRSVLLKRDLIDDLSHLRVTELTVLQNFGSINVSQCLLFLLFFFLF